jgi:tetratricopeptide (TPR) repeat protein
MPRDKTILCIAVALLFVSHPLATQSVTYIVQRMTSMSALFYFLSLICYMLSRFTEKGRAVKTRLLIACGISALLAILTKENAFTIPFAIVLLELCFLQSKQQPISFKDKRVVIIGAAMLVLIALGFYSYWDVLTQPQFADQDVDDASITSMTYFMTQFSVILKYIQLLILPVNQVFDYNYELVTSFWDPRAWVSLLALIGLAVLAIFTFKKQRIISFGIGWFFLTLSIESSIIPIRDVIFEHRTYLPSFGFLLILVYGVYSLTLNKYHKIGLSFLALLTLTYSVLTYMRNNVWKNEITLSTDSIRKSPGKARPYNNRGDALVDENRMDEAFKDFNTAISIHPKYSMAFFNRGNMFNKQKNYERAIADFDSAILYRADFARAYNNRGSAYKELKRFDEALSDYNRAIDMQPEYAMAFNNRATVYMLQGQYQRAIEDLNKAIELSPGLAEAVGNRGLAKLQMGNADGCTDLQRAGDLGFAPAEEFFRKHCRAQSRAPSGSPGDN